MATKRSPAPGEATSSSHTNRDCSRHRASPRTISGWPNRAAKPTGHWRNTSVRCWPWNPTLARNPVPANVSAIRVSRQSRRSPISTSPPTPLWTALRSPAWKPADGWPRPAILCCSARLAPAKPTWRPRWRSPRPTPGTGSPSPRPPAGSPYWPKRTASTRTTQDRPLRAHRHRRSRLHPIRHRSGEPVLPTRLHPIREIIDHLDLQLPFSRWGQVFGEATIASAMIYRIVHHADVIALKGASYRIKHTAIESLPSVEADRQADSTP